ncbi:MAG: LysE family transporter [Proteobacteria bacterium]|nr:LysE family transporter [Pseudomonadota bacterium]HQR05080.1 LysE family transporter [Rhodocyclaceae bacterium]
MSVQIWLAYCSAAIAISLSPGPGAVASMTAGLRNGFMRGYGVVLGLQLGIIALFLVAASGIGALLASSPRAFALLRWSGVAYLVWLGLAQWRAKRAVFPTGSMQPAFPEPLRTLLLRGFLVNISNPKGLLFLLAVTPQFIDATQPLALQYFTLAATTLSVDMTIMAGYTLLPLRIATLFASPDRVRWLNRALGLLFLLMAASLATFHRQ